MICKSCQTKEAFPNATTMFKHVLGCQKCPADVLLCLLFLFKSSWLPPSRMKYQTLIPLVKAPGRQEDPLQLLFLYAQPPHSGLFHYPQATTWGTRLDTRKKGCENTVVGKMIPEDHGRTNNFLQASPCPSRLAGDVSVLRQGRRISHGGFGVSL